ncbi:MAG: LysR family transcriptional regulator [Peptostreptococcaceae bacterium]|nr:LysR family transcriptional regulator [Peptostreptococcaceae bacterium]
MEFRTLMSFIAVAEMGSYTRAAEKLGYAQSTVSTHIRALEQEFDFPLFDLIANKVFLTAKGALLLEYAYQVIELEEKIRADLREGEAENIRICIGAVESIMTSFILDTIGGFSETYPDIQIEIVQDITGRLLNLLRKNEIDIAIVMGMPITDDDICVLGKQKVRARFFCSSDHPLAEKPEVCLSEVLRHRIILTGADTFLQKKFEAIIKKRDQSIYSNINSHCPRIIIDMVRRNLGVSLLPDYLLQRESEEIQILKVPDFSLSFYLQVCHHKGKYLYPTHKEFIRLVKEKFRQKTRIVS